MSYLILARHGITDWNIAGKWQGIIDTSLSEKGRQQARQTARLLEGIKIDSVYTSVLKRVTQTYDEICNKLGLSCPVLKNSSLNERDYGIYAGRNKWEVKKELGEEEFTKLRRGWNYPVPEGETLEDVYNRVVPFFEEKILTDLKSEKNVLVISSGNTLRALIKYLENIPEKDIENFEVHFGQIIIYEFNKEGEVISKQIKN